MKNSGSSRKRSALVVAYYFPPVGGGGVARTLELVGALARSGWRTIVLTVDAAAWVQDPALLAKVPPGAAVLRVPNPDWGRVALRAGGRPAPGRGRGRLERWLVPDLHLGWSALASAAASSLALVRAVDVVYTTSPPYSAQAVGLVAHALGVPWVADFRDAWTENHARTHLAPWRRRLEERFEEAVLRRADRVVFASDGARDRALRRLPQLAERSEKRWSCAQRPQLRPPRGLSWCTRAAHSSTAKHGPLSVVSSRSPPGQGTSPAFLPR